MAMAAVSIQIRTSALFQAAVGVTGPGQPWQGRNSILVDDRRKQADVVPGAKFVVPDAVRESEVAIHLPGFNAQHATVTFRMTRQAILAAGVIPGLRASPIWRLDEDGLRQV